VKYWISGLIVAVVLVFSAPAARAQDVVDPETGEVYKKRTVYDFEDDVVEGTLVKPEGDYLQSRQRGKQSSLIKIRDNFVPEMLKSAEDL
jgi:hypothetical protein